MSDIAEVWREYKKTGDPYLQEELVLNYQGLVYKLAHKIVRKLKQGTEVEDLIADGMVGLVKAIDAFELERGFKFSTYATPVVRGSILNGLRRLDWLPERTRTKARHFQKAMADLEQVTGRKPSEEDIAKHMEISAKEVYDIIADLSSMYLLSLDTPLGTEDSDASVGDMVEDTGFVAPDSEFEFEEERDALRASIEKLDEREREIIEGHYFGGETFEAISQRLGVSKQRVSQLHLRAVRKMRDSLGEVEVTPDALKGFTLGSQSGSGYGYSESIVDTKQ
ncbi:MAG: sigma-70 family RNA polymerase sigma factor [Vulcanimicrobiota bacterium]